MEHVVLVDVHDQEVGVMEKLEAHKRGILHRAFSILLFNSNGEMLLQKRAAGKYHSAELWSNTCCSHPLPEETLEMATQRKLQQEMGVRVPLEFAYKFIYKATFENGLIEHEYDHVYTGIFNGIPEANPHEVADWRFVPLSAIRQEMRDNPQHFTEWFKLIMHHPELASIAV